MNMFRTSLISAALGASLLLTAPARAADVAYTLDPGHTQVDFRWSHMGLSTPAASFDQVEGTLKWDARNPTRSSVTVTMPLAGLDTRVPALDAHLKAPDFFDAARYPNVTFRSTSVERGKRAGEFRIHGILTVKDTSRPVVLDARLNGAKEHPMMKAPAVGFDATTRIKRSDFGLGAMVPMVSDAIDIRITTEAIEANGYKRAMEAMQKAAAGD